MPGAEIRRRLDEPAFGTLAGRPDDPFRLLLRGTNVFLQPANATTVVSRRESLGGADFHGLGWLAYAGCSRYCLPFSFHIVL